MFAASKSGQVTGTTPPPPTPTNDPQFNYVTALITGDGTNGAQNNTFVDSSPNNFTVTRAGNTTQGSASPYGGNWSNYFDGSSGLGSFTGPSIGNGNYTIEFWVYHTILSGDTDYYNIYSGTTVNILLENDGTGRVRHNLRNDSGTSNFDFYTTVTLTANTWNHLAFVVSGSTAYTFINGVGATASVTGTRSSTYVTNLLGALYSDARRLTGYLSNFRLVKGTALYTSNFTPSTTPLTAITNTNLLTCQSPRFTDNSINNFAIPNISSVSIQSFNPFEPATLTPISYSGYFNGSTDYLSLGASTNLALGAGNFTIECWLNITAYNASTSNIFEWRSAGGVPSNIPTLYLSASGVPIFYASVGSGALITGSSAIALNTWTHLAIVRNGSTVTMYLNGTSIGSATNSANLGNESFYINDPQSSYRTNAYFSNVRMVIGTAVYTANFTPSTTPLTAISGTSLLTCQSNYFVDNSVNNFSITPVGSTKTTIQNPFGTTSYSQYFNGSSYLSVANNAAFTFGSGSFTVECWFYAVATTGSVANYSNGVSSNSSFSWEIYQSSATGIQISIFEGATQYVASSTGFSTNAWNHVAAVRNGNTLTIYINGVAGGTTANVTNVTANNPAGSLVYIGAEANGGTRITGYLSNFRIVKGTAVYTANFNPSTTPLTAITGTSLLTCQNLTQIDNSSNAFTITNTGAKGSLANPFPFGTTSSLTTGYSSSVASGSVYFNGSADYLLLPVTTALAFPADYTLECWVYLNSVSGNQYVYSSIDNGSDAWQGIVLGFNGTSFVATSYVSLADTITHQTAVTTGQWYHLAMVRSGSTTKSYLNGVQSTSTTNSSYSLTQSGSTIGAGYAGSSLLNGCISNLRIVKGTALYTASFTPPTSPLTAITNTQLLTCQSSTSITDASTNAFTFTTAGTPTPKIANPYGITSVNGSSIFLDGTGDYLTIPASATTTVFGGDFTVEAWVYPTVYPHANGMFLFDARTSGNPNNWCLYFGSGDSLIWVYNGGAVASTTSTFPQNRWYHIAYSRSGTTGRLFVNGVVVSAPTDGNNYSQTTILTVGGRYTQDYVVQGYMSSVRIVKGTALYKSAFVPPSAPVVTPSGTSLLLNGTNAGIFDNAMMNDYETGGNAQISTTVKKYGTGSVAFDGTGDYLKAPFRPQYSLKGDFTVEAWVYITTNTHTGNLTIASFGYNNSTGTGPWGFYLNGTGPYTLYFNTTGTNHASTTTATFTLNTWIHVAYCRSGTSGRFFVNGTIVGTAVTDSSTYTGTTESLFVGTMSDGATAPFVGYMDDVRITNYARYVANFTPPTEAFPIY